MKNTSIPPTWPTVCQGSEVSWNRISHRGGLSLTIKMSFIHTIFQLSSIQETQTYVLKIPYTLIYHVLLSAYVPACPGLLPVYSFLSPEYTSKLTSS